MRRSIHRFVLTACMVLVGTPLPALAADTITIGVVGTGSAMNWPMLIAVAKGFAKEQNLILDVVSAPSSAAVQQQVASGAVAIGEGGLPDVLHAIDQGSPVSVLRIQAKSSPYVMLAKPSISSYGMLKGKIISIGGPKDITRLYLDRMLEPSNIKTGDYDVVYAGASGARFAALQAGAIDATLLAPPFSVNAERLGFARLGLTADYVKEFPYTGFSVNSAWARQHKDVIARFMKIIALGTEWLKDPKNKAEAVEILSKDTKTDPNDAAKTWDMFMQIDMYDVDGSPDRLGLETLTKALKAIGDISGDATLARFYDATLLVP